MKPMKSENSLKSWSRTPKFAAAAAVLLFAGAALYLIFPGSHAPPLAPAPDQSASISEVEGATSPSSSTQPVSEPAKPQALFVPKSAPEGNPLPAPGLNPDADKGRVVRLKPLGLPHWGALKQGGRVLLPTATGETLEGVVNLVMEDNGWIRLGGALSRSKGTFALNTRDGQVAGQILLPEDGIGYEIRMDGEEVLLIERRLSGIMGPSALPSAKPPRGGAAVAWLKRRTFESRSDPSAACQRGGLSTIFKGDSPATPPL